MDTHLFTFSLVTLLTLGASLGRCDEGSRIVSEFNEQVLPFLNAHCSRCHGAAKQEAELRLDTLASDFTNARSAATWGEVMRRISSAEMPPEDEPQPEAEESARITEWLSRRLKEGEAARLAERARVSFYKLTREEYANTIYDLLGVHCDAADPTGLPEDPNWHGFERVGSMLSLSPAHVEKYLALAETALEEAFPAKAPEKVVIHWRAADMTEYVTRRGDQKQRLEQQGLLKNARLDVWPGSTFLGQPGSVQHLELPCAGDYRVRIRLSGLKPPAGRAPHLAIYMVDLDRMLFEQDVVAPEDQPVTLEFHAHLPAGHHTLRMSNEAPGPSNLPRAGRNGSRPFFSIKDGRNPWQTKLTDEEGQPILPFLIVDWMEWEGPLLSSWPTPAQETYSVPDPELLTRAPEILTQFCGRAFRRPPKATEVNRFVELVESEIRSGEKPASALKTALAAVLCSKDFFYLIEGSPDRATNRITDWELASRLSYFLWSTMPDGPLLDAARSNTLHRPEVLRAQVMRMMKDPRIKRFTTAFSSQWLQLQSVGMFPPDKKLYPEYDDHLQRSMVKETTAFFHHVLETNLSLREFLDSDWTMLNARLAAHYGISQVDQDQFVRVAVRPEDHRGGLLTQASVLSLTSDGRRHRPVHRGKWVLESILGQPPPPPPANVKPVETTAATEARTTLRMKLAAHQSDANCASCHRRIDPLGFAFDNYDAIGRWRTEEVVGDGSGHNPAVDASGQLADGRRFSDAAGLKRLLLEDLDKFNAAFVEKLAIYALRRAMTIDDRDGLARIAQQSKAADYRLTAIVESLVVSDLFQQR